MGSPNISNNPSQLKINEDIFIQILKKEKPVTTPQKKVYKKNRIYSNMRILSNTALDIKPKKYYKFPFTHIKNFTIDMQKEWLIAIKNAFYNFTNNNKPFYLLFIDSLLIFKDEKVKTDTKLVDMFDKEDIKYKRKGESIVFSGVDIKMLFDFVVNYEYMKTLPFILSRSKFVNSVYYKNVVRMCGIVKNQDKMQYHYNLSGFFFVNDYKKLFVHELSFEL